MALSDKVVTKAGFKLIIKSGTLSKQVKEAVLEGLKEVTTNYKEQVDKNLSLDDHTLEELRAMDYPYAVGKPENVPHDDRMIHEQAGELKRSIKVSQPEETTSRVFSTFVTTSDPKAVYLIYGTEKMRPRRFHEKAYEDIKQKFWNPIIKRIKSLDKRIETFSSTGGNS